MAQPKLLFTMLVVVCTFMSLGNGDDMAHNKKRGKMASVSVRQTSVGNTGNRAVSSSSSPATASVRNQSSAVSIGNPGQPGNVGQVNSVTGNPYAQPVGNNGLTTRPAPNLPGVTEQGQSQTDPSMPNIPGLDQNTIQSYVEQFHSGAVNPQQFTEQLRAQLGQYRDKVMGGINAATSTTTNPATSSARGAVATARQTLDRAGQRATAAAAGTPAAGPVAGALSQAGGALSDAEQWLIERESGGDVNAYNPVQTDSGNAFGLGQLTTANRQRIAAALGISNPDTTNYDEQLAMMRYYINERYGSPEAAVAFWRQNGWY